MPEIQQRKPFRAKFYFFFVSVIILIIHYHRQGTWDSMQNNYKTIQYYNSTGKSFPVLKRKEKKCKCSKGRNWEISISVKHFDCILHMPGVEENSSRNFNVKSSHCVDLESSPVWPPTQSGVCHGHYLHLFLKKAMGTWKIIRALYPSLESIWGGECLVTYT